MSDIPDEPDINPEFWDRLSRLLRLPQHHAATVDQVLHRWDEGDPDSAVVSLTRGGWLQLQWGGITRTLPVEAWLTIVRACEPETHAIAQMEAHRAIVERMRG